MRYVNARNTAFGEDRRSYKETDSGVSSTQRVFNVSYDNGRVEAYLNGVRLFPDEDYTKTSSGIGTSITLASDLGSNNVLEVVGYQGINSGNALVEDNFVVGTDSTGSGGAYDGTSGTNSAWDDTFPVASSQGDTVSVWRNGVKLVPTTDYTVNPSASTVYLVSPAVAGDEITVQVVGGVIHNNGLTVNGGSNSFSLPTTRGTDDYVLTRDDSVGTGGTAWKETIVPPTIISITYPTQNGVQATALASTGAQDTTAETLLINGQNLGDASNPPTVQIQVSGSYVTFAGTVSCNTAGTVITCANVTKQASADNYTLRLTHGIKNQVATTTVNFSGDPSFTTASGSLGTVFTGSVMSALRVNAGSSVTWIGGATNKPTWMTVTGETSTADNGLSDTTYEAVGSYIDLGGTPTNSGTSEVQNFNIIIRDSENQSHNRDFSLAVVDAPTGGNGNNTYTPTGSSTQYYVVKFTADGTFTLHHDVTVDYLVIAGGGAGGAGSGSGGGGAGGFLTGTGLSMTAGAYAIDVGAGGTASQASANQSNSGSPSIVTRNSDSTVILKAIGGGYGGNENDNLKHGGAGGSGGGGRGHNSASGNAGNASNSGVVPTPDYSTIFHYGNNGGAGGISYHGGGGGGAGTAGTASGPSGGDGGDGRDEIMGLTDTLSTELLALSNINAGVVDSGTRYLAGGGGGMRQTASGAGSFSGTSGGPGGKGGGATGGWYASSSNNGGATTPTANTGSGGGASHSAYGASTDGASGIVILRFAI